MLSAKVRPSSLCKNLRRLITKVMDSEEIYEPYTRRTTKVTLVNLQFTELNKSLRFFFFSMSCMQQVSTMHFYFMLGQLGFLKMETFFFNVVTLYAFLSLFHFVLVIFVPLNVLIYFCFIIAQITIYYFDKEKGFPLFWLSFTNEFFF